MKRSILLLSIPVLLLLSCENKKTTDQNLLTAANLKSSFITLTAGSAYTLKAPKGAILKIAGNSFDVKPGEKIKLEIKEAYSASDILLAGLTTKSNGRLLQSGGMIYINATANDEPVKIIQPINVSIPSPSWNDSMQLFKGEIAGDGSINWVDPQPLDTSLFAKRLMYGKALFNANCASCHKPTKDFTAPALMGWKGRVPGGDWIYKFIANSAALRETEPYAKALFLKWNKTQMTAFPNLGKADVDAIMNYSDNEAMLNPVPFPTPVPAEPMNIDTTATMNTPAIASCFDTGFYPMPDTNIKVLPVFSTTDTLSNADMQVLSQIPMYQFNIDQLGWYNVDCFITANRDMELTDVTLLATLKMPKDLDMQVYLCIPQRKLLTYGNQIKDHEYQFYNTDGIIPLILNDDAIIFAIGSDTANAYYGLVRFNVKPEQHIIVNIKASTKEDILNAIKSNSLDGIKIEIEKPRTYIMEFTKADSLATDTLKQQMEMQIMERPCNNATNQIYQVKK